MRGRSDRLALEIRVAAGSGENEGRDRSFHEHIGPALRGPWKQHGWLPLALPVSVRTFWTDDERLAASIAAAGGTLDRAAAEIELRSAAADLETRSPYAAVVLGGIPYSGKVLAARRAARIGHGLLLRFAGRRERRRIGGAGYAPVLAVSWDEERAQVPAPPGWRSSRALADAFPHHLALLATTGAKRVPTVFEDSLQQARPAFAGETAIDSVLVRDASVVVVAQRDVVRVGLGEGGRGVHRQVTALGLLRSLDVPDDVAARAPRITASGQSGLGHWSCESRAPGSQAGPDLGRLGPSCLEFLLALSGAWRGPVSAELASDAVTIASSCPPRAAEIRFVAEWVQARLPAMGLFGHGDFFHGNLLVDGTRLVGVLDWERSAIGRPAVQDVLHLIVAASAASRHVDFGRAVIDLATRPEDVADEPLVRAYTEALGLTASPTTLLAVLGSCWLSHVSHELDRIADNSADSGWMSENVELPSVELARIFSRS